MREIKLTSRLENVCNNRLELAPPTKLKQFALTNAV